MKNLQHLVYGWRVLLVLALVWVGGGACKDHRSGQTSANEAPVPDGQIVLLRRGNEMAAFILRNQTSQPERTDYTWYYRADGKGTFPVKDPAVMTGTVTNASQIAFATFSVEWSINGNGRGWVYFSAGPTDLQKKTDYAMCVTTETNLASLDAKDRHWDYRSRPGINVKALIESQLK